MKLRHRLIGMVLVFWMVLGAVYWLRPGLFLDADFARQRWMAGLHLEHIEFDGQLWVYAEGGKGEPVVLVHGLAGSKENWYPTARYLDGYHLYVPDLSGFGESENSPDGDYRVSTQVARLHAYVEALGLERFHLAGHSMGGHIAGVYAAEHPERVRSLSLVNSAGVPFPRNPFQAEVEGGGNPFVTPNLARFDRFIALAFKHPPFAPPRVRAAYAARTAPRAELWGQVLKQLIAEDQVYFLQTRLPELPARTLVLWCEDDQMLDVRSVDAFRAGLREPRIEVLPDCGHMTPMEAPKEAAALLRAQFEQAE
ncbi:MAG: alpha/beta hydrolase [Ahniella sp.]|nr:alpha/beta hydrolase [Ahniella sp.]